MEVYNQYKYIITEEIDSSFIQFFERKSPSVLVDTHEHMCK